MNRLHVIYFVDTGLIGIVQCNMHPFFSQMFSSPIIVK